MPHEIDERPTRSQRAYRRAKDNKGTIATVLAALGAVGGWQGIGAYHSHRDDQAESRMDEKHRPMWERMKDLDDRLRAVEIKVGE